jgi:hypothetical protein
MSSLSGMRYSYWDILKAPRIALSGKNLLAQGRNLLFGYVIYLVLTYIAMLLDGVNWQYIWGTFCLFPFTGLDLYHWYAKVIWAIAVVQFLLWFYYGSLTVARLAFEELKGNYFFSCKEAARGACANLRVLVVAMIVMALVVIALSLLQAVVGLITLIPVVGEIIYALIYGIPIFVWSLFIVFVAFGLSTAFFTLPAIVTLSEKDSFGATFYVFNVIWTQPLRWFSLTGISLILAKVGTFVFGYFIMRGLQLSNYLATFFAGDKIKTTLTAAYALFATQGKGIDFFTSLYPGSGIAFQWISFVGRPEAAGSEYVAAIIMLAILILLAILVISYGLNIITCGQVIAFLLVRYSEDREKLTEELEVTEITAADKPESADEKTD